MAEPSCRETQQRWGRAPLRDRLRCAFRLSSPSSWGRNGPHALGVFVAPGKVGALPRVGGWFQAAPPRGFGHVLGAVMVCSAVLPLPRQVIEKDLPAYL